MNETERFDPITEPVGTIKVDRHTDDWLRRSLLASNLALMCGAGLWAIWTHREWIRAFDTVLVLVALAEFTRVLVFTKDG